MKTVFVALTIDTDSTDTQLVIKCVHAILWSSITHKVISFIITIGSAAKHMDTGVPVFFGPSSSSRLFAWWLHNEQVVWKRDIPWNTYARYKCSWKLHTHLYAV